MIETYITAINEAIRVGKGTLSGLINGIAQPVTSGDTEIPYITVRGEANHVFIDDAFDFGCYHKQNGITYVEDYAKGYGDAKRIREVQDLSLIVWGFIEKITAEQFKDLFLSVSPEFVRFVSVSFDKKTIYNAEFKGIDYQINEDIFLIRINYRVQYDINKKCLNIN